MRGGLWAALGLFGLLASGAQAADCTGNPRALGTSRVISIDPAQYARIGAIQYQRDELPLNDREVVLTFDDGPLPPYTNRVLEILAAECVRANFFIVGRMAAGYPDLLRRIVAEGHVVGTHSQNHPLTFDKMPLAEVRAEIEQGIASSQAVIGAGKVAPFFRIPGLLRASAVEDYARRRGLSLWSADLTGDDWRHISASEVVKRVMNRLDERGKGIVLLHDIQPATVLALPELLRQLKARGYRIVQVAPKAPADEPLVARGPTLTPAVTRTGDPARESRREPPREPAMVLAAATALPASPPQRPSADPKAAEPKPINPTPTEPVVQALTARLLVESLMPMPAVAVTRPFESASKPPQAVAMLVKLGPVSAQAAGPRGSDGRWPQLAAQAR